jgi:hypothetical protein
MTRNKILESLKEARDAACYVARSAAWATAWYAARDAARDAARYAARDAACYVARSAAWYAKQANKKLNHREVTLDLI